MMGFLRKRKDKSKLPPPEQAQARIDDENEVLAMSCGSFSPQLLAKIKRSKDIANRH